MPANYTSWLKAARLRTLPLAFSSILLGSFLAGKFGNFNWSVFVLALLTTLFLQLLSNFANDYGDAVNDVDNETRLGPPRAIQSGEITLGEMKKAIFMTATLAFFSGIALIVKGTSELGTKVALFFLLLGLLSIAAAVLYTVGKRPYGYRGFGDLFVFLFFGIIGVGGTYFLHNGELDLDILLPASAVGLLSAGVLNLNNMRDLEADKKAGKITLAVLLGIKRAKMYHMALISIAVISAVLFTVLHFHSPVQFLYLLTLPLLASNAWTALRSVNPVLLDPQLKKLAIATFLFVLTFGIGLIFS